MRELFPEAKPEERVKLLEIFAPNPRLPNTTKMLEMSNPPTLDEFLTTLRPHGLGLEVRWKRSLVSPWYMDIIGSLRTDENYELQVTLTSHLAKEMRLLINDCIELSNINATKVMRDMAKLLQNDVIQLYYSATNISYLVYDFERKNFISRDGMPEEKLRFDLFCIARTFLKEKKVKLPLMNRGVVFTDKVHA